MAKSNNGQDKSLHMWALARISLGMILLWAFLDKLLGLGFATCRDANTDAVATMCSKAWINGGSPTTGFLKFAAKGPFAGFYNSLAGNQLIDILFMGGLLLIGVALIFGIAMKLATISGSLLFLMMWSAVLPPGNNPVLDDHIVYILILLGLKASNDKQKWGLRNWWMKQSIVRRFPVLE